MSDIWVSWHVILIQCGLDALFLPLLSKIRLAIIGLGSAQSLLALWLTGNFRCAKHTSACAQSDPEDLALKIFGAVLNNCDCRQFFVLGRLRVKCKRSESFRLTTNDFD
jgi:hypothetical protein